MGVYNPNMKMPENCDQCPISNCRLDNGWLNYPTRPLGCPLIYVPEHGRLIDADALASMYDPNTDFGKSVRDTIKDCPTIIPKDKEEQT